MTLHHLLRMLCTRARVGGVPNTLPIPSRPFAVAGYISAPITETEHFPSYQKNVNWLKKKSDELFQMGYAFYCPKVVWFKDPGTIDNEKYTLILLMDLSLLPRLDFIYMRWGWERSHGCTVEHEFVLDFNTKWWVRLLGLQIRMVYQTEEEALLERKKNGGTLKTNTDAPKVSDEMPKTNSDTPKT